MDAAFFAALKLVGDSYINNSRPDSSTVIKSPASSTVIESPAGHSITWDKKLQDYIIDNESSPSVVVLIIVVIAILVFSGVLSVIFLVMIYTDYMLAQLKKNPLKNETPDYKIIYACSFRGSNYKYILFPIIGVVCIILLGIAIQILGKSPDGKARTIRNLLVYLTIGIWVVFVIYFLVYLSTLATMKKAQRHITSFNDTVAEHMYPPVMSDLMTVPNNSVETTNNIRKILYMYKPSAETNVKPEEELGRVFYTLNMYQHF